MGFSENLNQALDWIGFPDKHKRATALQEHIERKTEKSVTWQGVQKWLKQDYFPRDEAHVLALEQLTRRRRSWLLFGDKSQTMSTALILKVFNDFQNILGIDMQKDQPDLSDEAFDEMLNRICDDYVIAAEEMGLEPQQVAGSLDRLAAYAKEYGILTTEEDEQL